jgi:hypothetical protein
MTRTLETAKDSFASSEFLRHERFEQVIVLTLLEIWTLLVNS